MIRGPFIVILVGTLTAMPASGCELDGINHGIFGAWGGGARLHVLVKQQEEEPQADPEVPAADATAVAAQAPVPDGPTSAAATTSNASAELPPAPRRNFAAWARPRLSAPVTAEAAPAWASGAAATSSSAPAVEPPPER